MGKIGKDSTMLSIWKTTRQTLRDMSKKEQSYNDKILELIEDHNQLETYKQKAGYYKNEIEIKNHELATCKKENRILKDKMTLSEENNGISENNEKTNTKINGFDSIDPINEEE